MSATEYSIDKKTGLPIIDKTLGEQLDYPFNFTDLLAEIEDTISTATGSVTFTMTEGLTLVAQSQNDYYAVPLIAGGTLGKAGMVTCRVHSATGNRIFERSILINIVGVM